MPGFFPAGDERLARCGLEILGKFGNGAMHSSRECTVKITGDLVVDGPFDPNTEIKQVKLRHNRNTRYVTVTGWPSKEDDVVANLSAWFMAYNQKLKNPEEGVFVLPECMEQLVPHWRIPPTTTFPMPDAATGSADPGVVVNFRVDDLGIEAGGEVLQAGLNRVAESVVENLADHDALRMRLLGLMHRLGVWMPDDVHEHL